MLFPLTAAAQKSVSHTAEGFADIPAIPSGESMSPSLPGVAAEKLKRVEGSGNGQGAGDLHGMTDSFPVPRPHFSPYPPHDAILLPTPWLPLLIGPYGGIEDAIHRGQFNLTENGILCCEFEKGNGIGYTGGLKAFIPLGERSYLSPRLGYTKHNGNFTVITESFPFFGLDDSVELMRFRDELDAPLPSFVGDFFYCYRIDSSLGLYLGAGPSVEYIAAANFTKTESIEEPVGVTYLNGRTSRTQELDLAEDVANLVFSGRGGIIMLYPVTPYIYLNPEITFAIPINTVSESWRMYELQGTLGILFMF